MINLKRSVYENFKNWKYNNSNRALFVKGARQVGRTYIVNKFAKDNYKQINYALYVKWDNYGGINDKGTIITIPIFSFPRFKFDAGGEDRKFGSLNIF